MAGQIGFDEGGVLEALSKPLVSHVVTKSKTSKAGKVTTETTTFEISAATILFAFTFWKIIALFGQGGALEDWKPGDLAATFRDRLKEDAKSAKDDFEGWLKGKGVPQTGEVLDFLKFWDEDRTGTYTFGKGPKE